MANDARGDALFAEATAMAAPPGHRGRPMSRANILSATPSPVNVLLAAGLQASRQSQGEPSAPRLASAQRDDESASPSRSPSEPPVKRWRRPAPATATMAMPPTYLRSKPTSLQKSTPEEGILLDAHSLVRDASVALDVFKGSLVVLMVASNTIITMSSISLRSHSFGSLLICNTAASLCFVGFLMAFGFSCYGQYFSEWSDPVKEVSDLRFRVLRAVTFPVVGAWVCNFAWCFLCLKNSFTSANLFDVFTFAQVFGNGPDFLCSFSLDLALVYLLWRPIMHLLGTAEKAEEAVAPSLVSLVSQLEPKARRDMAALAIVLCPLLTTLVAVPDCTSSMRWVQWFFVCDKRDINTPSLPAIPHLTDFGLGILAGVCWSRFLADLRPAGNGGPDGGLTILPLPALRRWSFTILTAFLVMLVLFLPLGQVCLHTDLSVVQMATPVGQLIRGFSNGPSMLWLLATLWPIATLAGFVVVLVTLRGTVLGCVLGLPLGWLEHLGANVLYYLVITDLILAGMFRGFLKDPAAFDLPSCLTFAGLILSFGRFLHAMCRFARK